jgi:hypothetical protein
MKYVFRVPDLIQLNKIKHVSIIESILYKPNQAFYMKRA